MISNRAKVSGVECALAQKTHICNATDTIAAMRECVHRILIGGATHSAPYDIRTLVTRSRRPECYV